MTFGDKLKKFFSLSALRDRWAEWAPLMPAKSNLDAEYNFPYGRWAGQGPSGRDKHLPRD